MKRHLLIHVYNLMISLREVYLYIYIYIYILQMYHAGQSEAGTKMNSDQSEAHLLVPLWPIRSSAAGTTGTVTGFCTKPPIMPYFSEFHSVPFNVLSLVFKE